MTNPQATGRAARAKGVRAELDLAKYLRTWWPHAERAVITGFRAGEHVSPDHGDIRNAGNLVWQCKYRADMTDKQIEATLAETQDQTYAANAVFGIFVQRRQGKTNPGQWWAWLNLGDLATLCLHGRFAGPEAGYAYVYNGYRMPPVRMLLADVVDLLTRAGHGEVDPWQIPAPSAG